MKRTILALLLVVSMRGQQEASPLTFVAIYKVKPAKVAGWVAAMQKTFVPALEKLMADGTILGYGVDSDVLHRAGMPNVDVWFSIPNYASLETAMKAIEKVQGANPAVMASLADMSDPDAHSDLLLRALFANMKNPPKGSLPYTSLAVFKAKPGKVGDLTNLMERSFKPMLDQMVAAGDIYGYSLQGEVEHSVPNTVYLVISMQRLAAQDKLLAALSSAMRTQPETFQRYEELSESGEHRDYLMRSHAYGVR
jgi:hypothetical protein